MKKFILSFIFCFFIMASYPAQAQSITCDWYMSDCAAYDLNTSKALILNAVPVIFHYDPSVTGGVTDPNPHATFIFDSVYDDAPELGDVSATYIDGGRMMSAAWTLLQDWNTSKANVSDLSSMAFSGSADDMLDGANYQKFSNAQAAKLAGIAANATANSSDAYLLDRTNHTGTQAISTVSGLQTALDAKVANTVTVNGHALSSNVSVTKSDVGLGNVANVDTTNAANIANGSVSNAEFQALDGVTSAIQTQINAKMATPTGTTSQYIRGDGTLATLPVDYQVINGTSAVSSPKMVFKAGTTNGSGQVVVYLTNDGTASGTALFSNVINAQVTINSTSNIFASNWSVSGDKKTLTANVAVAGSVLLFGPVPVTTAASGVPVNIEVIGN